jgi:O-antigen/teichoic acid export membrane protein
LGALYQRSAIYLLSTAQGAEQTGLFSAALRLVEAAKIGQIAVLSALFPAMAQAGQLSNSRARAQFQKVFTSSALGLFALTALIAVALGLLAQPIIELLYGADFAPASAVLRPLAWVLAPMTISHYLSLQLLARNGEKPIMLALLLSIIAFVAAFSPAITRFGLPGVAWAMLAAEGLQAGVLALAWRKVRA